MRRSVTLLFVFLAGLSTAMAGPLLVNGGFEAGLAGWLVVDQPGGSGSFFPVGGVLAPISLNPTVGPAGGAGYALSDQPGPGAHTLIQPFIVAAGSTVTLSFDMFVNDWSGLGPIVNPAGLDFTAIPNQHARVDILAAGAPPFDTGAGVLANFYLGVDPGANPHAYTSYLFDITSLVGGGGLFQIRFAEVDNQLYLNMGVDNVSIEATGVPEPATYALMGLALAALGFCARRRA